MSFSDSFAWQLTQLSTQAHRPLLVVTKHNRELTQLSQAIRFFNPSIKLFPFPDWEILPYERLSPAVTQVTQRLQTLSQLSSCQEGIILTTVTAFLQQLTPKDYIAGHIFQFSLEDKLDITQLNQKLAHSGYQRVTTVTLPGEFAVRGGLIDVFPLDTQLPFRVHTDIDTIENLYYFDPTTQQPHESIDSIRIIPTREFLLSEESIARFQTQGQKVLGEHFKDSLISQQLSTVSYVSGIEYYLFLFFEKTNTLLDYLPPNTHWLTALNLPLELDKSWKYVEARYYQLKNDIQWPILPPEKLYQSPSQLITKLNSFKAANVEDFPVSELPDLHETHPDQSFQKLEKFLSPIFSQTPKTKALFFTNRLSQQDSLLEHLSRIHLTPVASATWQDFLAIQHPYQCTVAPIKKGFFVENLSLLLIPDTALYSKIYPLSQEDHSIPKTQPHSEEAFNSLAQLAINDTVVHIDHGIGRYLGLQQIQTNDHLSEFIVLEYAESTKLYVPIQDIQYISRYTSKDNPSLNHLSSNRWKSTKQKTLTQLKDVAAELLDLYAKRSQAKGDLFCAPNADYEAFADDFEFEETKDQTTAIQDIIKDLAKPQPMDRLICGDVGFGKTEVAMRAAFLAAQSGKQVAILAPTTLLADQHYRNFRERFSDWPIKIDSLSRFRTTKDAHLVKKALSEGVVDIIIGTHALLSKTVTFKSLGLLVIDEEHHFGVQQKEKLKLLKTHINVLTLTATPIPRTLQTSLSGLRELSLITTPPPGRLPIKNFIVPHESTIIREAILRELLRGGQVYFVHNRVQSLARVARELQTLVPEAKIRIAHGQLPEKELETCMESFYQQQYNILLSTSIIETGLDIPTVNTLIVDRANHFGLAQLHQLRGRIGRSHHQAYAYFLVPEENQLTQDACKRIEALKSLTALGSGFNLASYDLDIRGAGNLLGKEQSGVMQGVGFSLYMELLEKTIESIKAGKQPDDLENTAQRPSLDLKIPAFIPDAYLPDISLRLQYYRKIAKALDELSLQHIQRELIDRYGLLPKALQNLFAITHLKQVIQPLGITKIEANTQGGWVEFSESPSIDPVRIIELIQKKPEQFKLAPSLTDSKTRLRFFWQAAATPFQKIEYIQQLLKWLN